VEQLTFAEIDAWAENLPITFLQCRAAGLHNMTIRDQWPVGRGGFGQLRRCTRCRLEEKRFLNAAGFVVEKKPEYPPGYLAPKGTGRRTKRTNGMFRLKEATRWNASGPKK
jgi:hypothetical protein